MIWDMLGRDPKCFTGGECWLPYDYSDRWLLLIGITISTIAMIRILKKIYENKAGKQEE
jgi:hypothetical protein